MKALTAVLATLALSAGVAHAQQEVVEYYHLDAIGSVRAVSNQANVVIERHDYLPFGEECATGACANNPGAGAGQPRKFTSKERDQETGLDYFGARYYEARIARFTTVDPVYTWKENLNDPQRWNRYAYGRDNPLRYVDPDGRVVYDYGKGKFERNARIRNAVGQFLQADNPDQSPTMWVASTLIDSLLAGGLPTNDQELASAIQGQAFGMVGVIRTPAVPAAASTALVRTGDQLIAVQDALAKPGLLRGKGPAEVAATLGSSPGWRMEKLGKGAHKGEGWVLREYTGEAIPRAEA